MADCHPTCELCEADATSGPGWRAAVGGCTVKDGWAIDRVVHETRRSYWVRKGRRTRRIKAEWWQTRHLPSVPYAP